MSQCSRIQSRNVDHVQTCNVTCVKLCSLEQCTAGHVVLDVLHCVSERNVMLPIFFMTLVFLTHVILLLSNSTSVTLHV